MSALVSAVTISWNSAAEIAGLLSSLAADAAVTEIIVVDNGSVDGTLAVVRAGCPSAKLIYNEDNRGFAAAANQGIRAATGEYILLVNPDISFVPGFVGRLLSAIDKPSAGWAAGGVGAVAPKLVRPDSAGLIDSAGLVMHRNRKALDRGREERDMGQYDVPCRVFGPCGACALLLRRMLDDVAVDGEVFDESFFSYKEDVDLAWRMNLMGWDTLYVPDAVAEHGRGWKESGRSSVPRSIRRHSHKNRYLTMIKNDDPASVLMSLPWLMWYELKLMTYALLFEPFLFLAYADVVKLLPDALAKRRDIMARRRISAKEMRRLFGEP
ncbi:MAG: glycosyltransferase family 2 protein [Nitrospirae bacterium]|nr:glycosyltransferase family 2 protein [Nitrospirota bacterium]